MILLPEPGPKPNGPSTLAGLPAPFRSLIVTLSLACFNLIKHSLQFVIYDVAALSRYYGLVCRALYSLATFRFPYNAIYAFLWVCGLANNAA